MDAPSRTEGQRVGRYELVRRVGRGGMGEVWKARLDGPAGFRKDVAIKLLRAGPRDGGATAALLREARVGALLQHPNVVGIHELGEDAGTWFLAMELVRGPPVSRLLAEGRASPRAVVEVGVQACAGLHHIHQLRVDGRPAGLVHRDIKPANLLIDQTGLVKIADLGIAALSDDQAGAAGTPGYMAPEQVDGVQDARSDLFALGATLYRLATGRRPFGRGSVALLRVQRVEHLLGGSGFLQHVEEAVPGLGEVLRRALRLDPDRRWPDAAAMGEALAALRGRALAGAALRDLLGAIDEANDPTPSGGDPSTLHTAETVILWEGNLPEARDGYLGREDETRALADALRSGVQLVAVGGGAGAGKTRLAVEAARSVERVFRGGTWFVDLGEARSADGVCFAVAAPLELPLGVADPVRQVGFALRARGRMLVILDSADGCGPELPSLLAQWCALAPRVSVVVTGRALPAFADAVSLVAEPLPREAALALLRDRLGGSVVPEGDLARLVDGLERLPLALELAAARAAQGRTSPGRRDRPDPLERSIGHSWDLLAPWGRDALAQLSVFEGGFDLQAAGAVLELIDHPEAGWAPDVLDALHAASLVDVDPKSGRLGIPMAIRAFAAGRLQGPARAAAEVRHAAYFAQLGSAAALEALHGPEERERMAGLVTELENLLAAARRARAHGDRDAATGAGLAAARVMSVRGPFAAVPPLLRETLAYAAPARRLQIGLALGASLDAIEASDEAEAVLRRCLEEAGDLRWRGAAHLFLGAHLRRVDRPDEARHHLEAAVAALREAGDVVRWASALDILASLESHTGELDAAIVHFDAALEVFRALGSSSHTASTELDRGWALRNLGQLEAARSAFEAALELAREVGNQRGEAGALTNLGVVHKATARFGDAERCYRSAIAVNHQVGNRRGAAKGLTNLGALQMARGDQAGAERLFLEALQIQRELGVRRSEGIILANLGLIATRAKRWEEARRYQEQALAIHVEVGNLRSQAMALGNLGGVAIHEERWVDGERHLGEAFALSRAIGDADQEAMWAAGLGQVRAARGDRKGFEQAQEAVARLRQLDNPNALGNGLCALAHAAVYAGDRRAAAVALAEAERVAGQLGGSASAFLEDSLAEARAALGR